MYLSSYLQTAHSEMLLISTAELTTLSLGVVAKFTIGQVDTEYEPWEGDLGMDFRDDKHCFNTSSGYAEVTILVRRIYRLVIHRNLKQKALWYKCQK